VAPAGALVPAGPLHALRDGRNELRIW
jgi:hypothetical protein